MDNIEGKKCPLCKERKRPFTGKLKKEEKNHSPGILYKCTQLHIFVLDGLDLVVQYSDKEEDIGKRYFTAELSE